MSKKGFTTADILRLAIIAFAYFSAHKIALLFPDAEKVLAAVWPAGGIGLAALLLSPRRLWPAIIAALFIAGNSANLLSGRPLFNSVGFMTANILESFCCAFLIIWWCGEKVVFNRVKEISALVFAATVVNAVTALVGAATAAYANISPFWSFWQTWWVSDGLGILILTPLITTWSSFRMPLNRIRWGGLIESTLLILLWTVISWLAFQTKSSYNPFTPHPYILFALLSWASLRLGMRGVTISCLLLAVISVTSEAVSLGPLVWGGSSATDRLLLMQMFLGFGSTTGFYLASSYNEAKMAEISAGESKVRMRAILDNLPMMAWLKDTESRLEMVNEPYAEACGKSVEYCIGKTDLDLFPEDMANKFMEDDREVSASGLKKQVEEPISTPEGVRWLLTHKTPVFDEQDKVVGTAGVAFDITDRKKAEEARFIFEQQLLHSQKLESLGILAGGIAHDFNNLLTSIMGGLSLARMDIPTNSPIKEILHDSEKACNRARDLTQQLLTFSRGGAPVKEFTNFEEIVRDCSLFAVHGSNVKCEFNIESGLWWGDIDRGQIGQVIHNLVLNAAQAMPAGGVIDIACNNCRFDAVNQLNLKEGAYVRLTVQDSGIGIPEKSLQKIFDPYFTTKQTGSGLGLASSYSIVLNHEGKISVESTLDKGSIFTIYLPADPARSGKNDKSKEKAAVRGFKGHLLIMDDEEGLRILLGRMLARLGLSVEVSSNGEEALELYKKALEGNNRFDAVIMDLTIPAGMGGKELMEKLIEVDPDAKAIVTSGYSNDPIMSNYRQFGFSAVLMKPYNIESLTNAMTGLFSKD